MFIFLAPAGRHVYSTQAIPKSLKAPAMCTPNGNGHMFIAGRHVYRESESLQRSGMSISDTLIVRAPRSAMCIMNVCVNFFSPSGATCL